ncbi:MFS transporter [Sphaerisporangium siamense]|uniref:EmrB/QacA subfamily drug resistance transporter n=1 Tax=Sphaerisporangium siamense TaxID=795645 RepID=A0A7W7DCA3_9ACTN|nr:MFS transporter [Sphaerisporangium siamense]MBB4704132.1 EmrB/QacA subfamily drug resistance transporter [Sphaerisporangium siamense]GII82610.1 MFS transporter [Sphaerisporangium siamense]
MSTSDLHPPAAPTATEAAYPSPRRRRLTLAAVALGVMMVSLDGTIVHVANPTIGRDLGASLAGLQWVTNGYLLALAVALVLGGKCGDRFGRRRVFLIGVAGFALTSLGCALSPSTEVLVAFRVLQGLAGAMLVPNTLALLRAAFPPAELDRAIGAWGGASALAAASGPIVGGLLVEYVSWQAIFVLNLPLGLAAVLLTVRRVPESRASTRAGGMDLSGAALLSGGLFLVVWSLILTQRHGWGSSSVLLPGLAGLAVLGLFIMREHRAADPLLPLSLFRSRSLSLGVALVTSGNFALYGVLFFIGLYLQNVHHYSPFETGLRMLPLTAVFAVSAPLGGFLTGRLGPRWPLFGGMLLLAGTFYGLTGLEAGSPYGGQWPYLVTLGLGMGLVIVASTEAIVANAPVEFGGVAGGLQTTANQLGGVLGTTVFGSVVAGAVAGALPDALAGAGVPGEVAARVAASPGTVGQGLPPIVPGVHGQVAAAVADASAQAFMTGLHTAMWVGAGAATASALLALLVRRGGHAR